jgi:hypothetical protein
VSLCPLVAVIMLIGTVALAVILYLTRGPRS